MKLINASIDKGILLEDTLLSDESLDTKIIGLAGNPNVGKSTIFNALTGLKQHTGNWPGKTVTKASGSYIKEGINYTLVDLPGTYSLMAHSCEEEIARDFICFGQADAIIVVCDATCLERNLNLVLQTLEITNQVIVCINLMDEAKKKHISLDLHALSLSLGVPIIGTNARSAKGLEQLTSAVETVLTNPPYAPLKVYYNDLIENAIQKIIPFINRHLLDDAPNARWIALRLLLNDTQALKALSYHAPNDFYWLEDSSSPEYQAVESARIYLKEHNLIGEKLEDEMVLSLINTAEDIYEATTVTENSSKAAARDRNLDRFLTSKWTGIPTMILLLILTLWITITGANYPSGLLFDIFSNLEPILIHLLTAIKLPTVICEILIYGVYRVLTWVVSVMLPPMAIFFPLFTLLEDSGYLPRIAFNLDKPLKKCCACGKQALTMCMGLGCNAAGVIGCRIIDSPRERLIAILTNNFIPCNGRFPTLISIITMFFIGTAVSPIHSFTAALILTWIIILGIGMTFLTSIFLSMTFLKGMPSSFTLELPPYRRPQIGKVLIRSLLDRTLHVLKRAVIVAAPAGLIIWLMANITINEVSLLSHCASFLDPFGHLIGLDGMILLAFILGFPANEIIVPILIMGYMSTGSIAELANLTELKALFIANGWTPVTALCMLFFLLMHWPCSTTCLTIKKETQSFKWTLISFLIPTLSGLIFCFLAASIFRLLGY